MNDFVAMGGYAVYVWGSFGTAIVLMAGLVAWSVYQGKLTRGEIRKQNQRESAKS